MEQFITLYLKLFFMMTPFFVLSVFLILSKSLSSSEKKRVILKLSITVLIISLVFLIFGQYIFSLFGITLDAFKIGAGTVLFLSALEMIKGDTEMPEGTNKRGGDFAIVPLAIPVAIGPGVIGILMVIGAELESFTDFMSVIASLIAAVLSIAAVLLFSNKIQQLLGQQGLEVLPKITGLFVSAIGAQIVFSGVKGFFVDSLLLH
ncbi:MarC family protein [Psychromonas sp. 14N.309.X.WAT.B.A12]|jgi:multiple antibiotic resistance protein|uniref:MarC family protein n=1 Tax=unclassified Psychromonas TaxID=2614957 RepID=UPI0025B0AAAE|nr:MarC family protein [Psychromonas sp. 14N.309.X.WAT.B.A12]MDN2662359.1 MarC family protein [Psychromonas sp. 14N.309.X.WAT.B.A12]